MTVGNLMLRIVGATHLHFFSQRVINWWNSLSLEDIDAPRTAMREYVIVR